MGDALAGGMSRGGDGRCPGVRYPRKKCSGGGGACKEDNVGLTMPAVLK